MAKSIEADKLIGQMQMDRESDKAAAEEAANTDKHQARFRTCLRDMLAAYRVHV